MHTRPSPRPQRVHVTRHSNTSLGAPISLWRLGNGQARMSPHAARGIRSATRTSGSALPAPLSIRRYRNARSPSTLETYLSPTRRTLAAHISPAHRAHTQDGALRALALPAAPRTERAPAEPPPGTRRRMPLLCWRSIEKPGVLQRIRLDPLRAVGPRRPSLLSQEESGRLFL